MGKDQDPCPCRRDFDRADRGGKHRGERGNEIVDGPGLPAIRVETEQATIAGLAALIKAPVDPPPDKQGIGQEEQQLGNEEETRGHRVKHEHIQTHQLNGHADDDVDANDVEISAGPAWLHRAEKQEGQGQQKSRSRQIGQTIDNEGINRSKNGNRPILGGDGPNIDSEEDNLKKKEDERQQKKHNLPLPPEKGERCAKATRSRGLRALAPLQWCFLFDAPSLLGLQACHCTGLSTMKERLFMKETRDVCSMNAGMIQSDSGIPSTKSQSPG